MRWIESATGLIRRELGAARLGLAAVGGLPRHRRRRLLIWGLLVTGLVVVGTAFVAAAFVDGEEREMLASGDVTTSIAPPTIVTTATTAASATSTNTTLPPLEVRGAPVLMARSDGIRLGDAKDAYLVPVGPVEVAYSDMMGGLVYKDKENRAFHFPAGAAEPVQIIEGHHFVKVVSDRGSPLVVYWDRDSERGLWGLNLRTNETRKLPKPSDGSILNSRTSEYWVWSDEICGEIPELDYSISMMVDDEEDLVDFPCFEVDGWRCTPIEGEAFQWRDIVWVTYSSRYFLYVLGEANGTLGVVVSDRRDGTLPYRVRIPKNTKGADAYDVEIIDLSWPRVLVMARYGEQDIEFMIDFSESSPKARALNIAGEPRLFVAEPY